MMLDQNCKTKYDVNLIRNVRINLNAVNTTAKYFANSKELENENRAGWLLKAITCVDLTTLAGDDTRSNVARLCYKAAKPLPDNVLNEFGFKCGRDCPIKTAAVCVYPSRVKDAVDTLKNMGQSVRINVASVATGFPSGQMPLRTRLDEIKYAVEMGATEIDIVIDRSLVITGKWEQLYEELALMKETCGPDIHMKSILATGELGNLSNVYKASMIAMMAGSDFIKTSTGKETINATLPFGIVMCRAIHDYYDLTGVKVGLKPAGGIRTSNDALSWLIMVKQLLGNEWLDSKLFRFGASGLLDDIEYNLLKYTEDNHN